MTPSSRRRLAVLGSPIAHSKSPALHAAAYGVLGLDWDYGRAEVTEAGLEPFLDGLDDSWLGLSLTMPLKRRVFEIVPDLDESAAETAQANTILFTDEGYRAFNTDVAGILAALSTAGVTSASTVSVLGGGATARSAVLAAQHLGATAELAVRDPQKVRSAGSLFATAAAELDIVPLSESRLASADVVISTIPGGADLGIQLPRLSPAQTLLDVVYDPDPTPLVAAWTAAGGSSVPGVEMLIHQAVHQIRIFRSGSPESRLPDEPAVIEAMRGAVGGS